MTREFLRQDLRGEGPPPPWGGEKTQPEGRSFVLSFQFGDKYGDPNVSYLRPCKKYKYYIFIVITA